MQFRHAIFVGAMAALAALAMPALARHSDASKTGEQAATSPGCSAQQRSADGTWTTIPCQELGSPDQAQHRSATRSMEEQAR
jgi:hypothetical protein